MMPTKSPYLFIGLTLAATLAACVAPPPAAAPAVPAAPKATEAPKPTEAPSAATAAPTAAAAPAASNEITTWYYYDQNNTDAKANERAGNLYIAKSMKQFNDEMAGKMTWTNVPRDYNLALDLVTGVQNGGDVPDVMQFGIADLPLYTLNNTIQNVEWARSEAWFKDLDSKGVEACTVGGKLMCVPISESPWLTFYWTDVYKDGFPKTPDDFLKAGAAATKGGNYAMTYWGNTAFDGDGTGRYFYQTISGFGGSYDDGKGNLKLNTPENVKAVGFMREVVKKGLASESVFAGNFEEEETFKQGKAGAFPTGFFIAVRYLNPLKSLAGKEYKDIEEAVNAGAVKLAPFVAVEGQKPGCMLDLFGFVVPRAAKNVDGAKAYINWVMDKKNMTDWIVNAGGGFPTSTSMRAEPTFQTEMYKQAQAVGAASACKPWYGSLTHIPEAKKIIANALFDLIKAKPDADIAATLGKADEEYAKLNK